MQIIEYQNWKRREQYEYFGGMDCPYFSLTIDIDVTKARVFMKNSRIPSYLGMIYIVSRALNDVEEFRVRPNIESQPHEVRLYDVIHPSYIVLIENTDKLNFCRGEFIHDPVEFLNTNKILMDNAKAQTTIKLEPERDDLIYMSCLPWIHFKSLSHPINYRPADFIPRITWGRFQDQGERIVVALNVYVHHGMIDGLHVWHFIHKITNLLESPEQTFENLTVKSKGLNG